MAAAALAYSSGIPLEHSLLAIRNLLTPEGRMQEIFSDKGSRIYVDFSHTPQALESILKEKSQLEGKLFLVIGCGGNRDTFKRKKTLSILFKKIKTKYQLMLKIITNIQIFYHQIQLIQQNIGL